MAMAGFTLAVLLSLAAGLQQTAAVEVASADEFVAAVKAETELIEVVDHLYLNTGAAVELAMRGDSGDSFRTGLVASGGYLISINGSRLTIKVCRCCLQLISLPHAARGLLLCVCHKS